MIRPDCLIRPRHLITAGLGEGPLTFLLSPLHISLFYKNNQLTSDVITFETVEFKRKSGFIGLNRFSKFQMFPALDLTYMLP